MRRRPTATALLGATVLFEPLGIDHAIAVRARDYELGQAPGLAFIVAFFSGKVFLDPSTTVGFVEINF